MGVGGAVVASGKSLILNGKKETLDRDTETAHNVITVREQSDRIHGANIMANAKYKAQSVDEASRTVTTVLGNGLKVVCCMDDIPESLHTMLALHGLKQKIGDAASGYSKTNDYSGGFSAMQSVVDNLMNGLWNAKGGTGTGDLVQAIANLKKISVEDAQATVDGLDEEQLKIVLGKPAVKAEILRIKAERAAAVAAASDDDGDIGV